MDKPRIAHTAPFVETLKPGRIYWWCACGLSKKQPFCDGSHKGTGFSPVKCVTEQEERVFFCGCKNSKNAPYCDGTHKQFR